MGARGREGSNRQLAVVRPEREGDTSRCSKVKGRQELCSDEQRKWHGYTGHSTTAAASWRVCGASRRYTPPTVRPSLLTLCAKQGQRVVLVLQVLAEAPARLPLARADATGQHV